MFKVQDSKLKARNVKPGTRNTEHGTLNPEQRARRVRARGLSLVELIVFIVIVSASVAGIISVITVTTRSSADPLIHKQALAIAEAVLEEIQLQPFTYCDPDDPGAATAAFVATPAADPTSKSTTSETGGTINVTHTISGSDRYVFVQVVHSNSYPSITSVVWDPGVANEALSVISTATEAANVRTVVYGLKNPTAKTATMRVIVSAGDSSGTFVAVSSYTGVHQTTPLGTPATATGGTGTNPTVTVTAATNDLVVDFMGTKETPLGSKTAGAGQTKIWDGYSNQSIGAGSTEAGAASVTMSWTGTTEEWTMVGVALKPAGSCPTLPEAIGPETYASETETRYSATKPFDNVNDYHGFDSNVAQSGFTGIRNIDSTLISGLEGYRVTANVAAQSLGAIGNDSFGRPQSLLITVTVTGPGNTSVTLNGYRTRYAPNSLP